jgi:DNA-binding MarR family transcriptional regulator
MVVKSNGARLPELDLAYLGFFLGLRVHELVMERTRKAGFTGVRESHGYLIQQVIESERTITELARRMGVTQQAASKMVAELIRLGILEATSARDRRAKQVRLSPRGWQCVRLGRRTRAGIETRLLRAAGKKGHETAKAALLTCLRALGGIERIRARRIRAPR